MRLLLTICNVDPELREQLRVRAAQHGRSMEAELREILQAALGAEERQAGAESRRGDPPAVPAVGRG